jgi:hypothetical protein
MRGVTTVVLAALVLAAAGAASAATPAAYRTKVNGICRSYTPKFKTVEAQMRKAEAAKDYTGYGVALGKMLVLGLNQDLRVEAVPVPAALKTTMAPIIARMKKVDVYVKAALGDAAQGYVTAMLADLKKIDQVGAPLNRMLDAAGLKDCGSNQS